MSRGRQKVYQGYNVLSVSGGERRLFQFGVSKNAPVPAGDISVADGKPLPQTAVSRDWRLLLKPRLDIAWLPTDSVFLRAVQLPACAPDELAGMIEFQIEKLSPMPPAQVVWTVENVPHPDATQQTAVVTIVSRAAVESFLGTLEQGGYTADRLDNPLLRELLAEPVGGDSLVLVADSSGPVRVVLLGWWAAGVLREVSLIRLPAEGAAATLVAQLNNSAWAAEIEGWLSSLPAVRLVAGTSDTELLLGALRDWSGSDVAVRAPRALPDLAMLTAAQALKPAAASLVPEDVRIRQRRQYVDTLWVKGLSGLGLAYLAFVFVYLAVLTYQKSRLDTLRDETRFMAVQYTNTLQIKARVRVLQEQVALRFAALDCWNAVVEKLPETLTLSQFDFKGGRTLVLDGISAEQDRADVTKFNAELRAAQVDGSPLFSDVKPATTSPRGGVLSWRFEAELRREEVSP
jgi:hypothetical protein